MSSRDLLYNKDILFSIKQFLENEDIIQLLLTSKSMTRVIGYKNIFTSISINMHSNLCDTIRNYLNHKLSIRKTLFFRIFDVSDLDIWPFSSQTMVFINCNIKKEDIIDRYKHIKNLIIKT